MCGETVVSEVSCPPGLQHMILKAGLLSNSNASLVQDTCLTDSRLTPSSSAVLTSTSARLGGTSNAPSRNCSKQFEFTFLKFPVQSWAQRAVGAP